MILSKQRKDWYDHILFKEKTQTEKYYDSVLI